MKVPYALERQIHVLFCGARFSYRIPVRPFVSTVQGNINALANISLLTEGRAIIWPFQRVQAMLEKEFKLYHGVRGAAFGRNQTLGC